MIKCTCTRNARTPVTVHVRQLHGTAHHRTRTRGTVTSLALSLSLSSSLSTVPSSIILSLSISIHDTVVLCPRLGLHNTVTGGIPRPEPAHCRCAAGPGDRSTAQLDPEPCPGHRYSNSPISPPSRSILGVLLQVDGRSELGVQDLTGRAARKGTGTVRGNNLDMIHG